MASEYQLMPEPRGLEMQTVLRLSDGAFIPFDGGNRDYQDYLEWCAAGNKADPADAAPAVEEAK